MEKRIFRIDSNVELAKDSYRMVLGSDSPVEMSSGQFVDIALEGFYLRRPISVCDCDGKTFTIVYKIVGEGTAAMARMQPGETIEILTALGHGFDTDACRESALLVGGGLGAAPMYLLAKELLAKGKKVSVVLGFNAECEVLLREDFRALGIEPLISTMDGSCGTRGFVTDAIREHKPEFDYFYTCGPMPMMKALCQMLDCKGEVSLEERMGCGVGYCYGCSCKTSVGTKRICKDGPVFKKEEVLW